MGREKKEITAIYQVSISQNAWQNLNEITGYISLVKRQPGNAIKVGDAIYATFDRIEKNPFAFHECEELRTKNKIYRRAKCYSWSIVYRIAIRHITILGIIHESMRPSAVKKLRRVD